MAIKKSIFWIGTLTSLVLFQILTFDTNRQFAALTNADKLAEFFLHWGFWLTSLVVPGMSLAFAVAGVLQTYLERVMGKPYMTAQDPIRFWMFVVFAHGILLV